MEIRKSKMVDPRWPPFEIMSKSRKKPTLGAADPSLFVFHYELFLVALISRTYHTGLSREIR